MDNKDVYYFDSNDKEKRINETFEKGDIEVKIHNKLLEFAKKNLLDFAKIKEIRIEIPEYLQPVAISKMESWVNNCVRAKYLTTLVQSFIAFFLFH